MNKYRSGSERKLADQLETLKVAYSYEPYYVPYMWIESKKYLPDFILPSGIILEVKGRFKIDDRKKHLFLRQSNPELDIRFVFDNPNTKLNKGGKSTYADWCNKNGFLFCKRSDGLPDGWLDGKVNRTNGHENKLTTGHTKSGRKKAVRS